MTTPSQEEDYIVYQNALMSSWQVLLKKHRGDDRYHPVWRREDDQEIFALVLAGEDAASWLSLRIVPGVQPKIEITLSHPARVWVLPEQSMIQIDLLEERAERPLPALAPERDEGVVGQGRDEAEFLEQVRKLQRIDDVCSSLIQAGTDAFRRHHFQKADWLFSLAEKVDWFKQSDAYYYRGMITLWQKQAQLAAFSFALDWEQRGSAGSFLLAQWSLMCLAKGKEDYLDPSQVWWEGNPPLALLEQQQRRFAQQDALIGHILTRILRWLAGSRLELPYTFLKVASWEERFWEGIILAEQGNYVQAEAAIQEALLQDMPPVLLKPLAWLEGHPAFSQTVVRPLFEKYRLRTART